MDAYDWGESYIRGKNGTEFIFKGLRSNYREIKSTSGINICWVEEAEAVSKKSWDTLIPTIREPDSEIWVTWNPEAEDSPVRQRFILSEPSGLKLAQMNWRDNPWFPAVLEQERQDCLRDNPDDYDHIWEGECITRSDAQILSGKWVVREFEPESNWDGPYHGADWGFGSDPTAAVRLWVADRQLWVEYESYAHHLELDDTGQRWADDIPGIEKYVVRADNARPESISHVKKGRKRSETDRGAFPIPRLTAVKKWPGSVEDGIKHLRSYRQIVIHPRCENTALEARKYSYKVDRHTGDVLPVIIDKHNHLIDSLRYALQPVIVGAIKFATGSNATIKQTRRNKRDSFGR
jgi:phage terminase large subunit